MSKPFDMDTFLMQGENLINAELLCNEIDNFIDSYFRKELNSDTLEYPFSDGRYVYFCPPQKNDNKEYIFEIGFGHNNKEDVFTDNEQEGLEKKLELVMKDYTWKTHRVGNWPNATKTWVCWKFDCDVKDMTLENIKKLAAEVKKALEKMKK